MARRADPTAAVRLDPRRRPGPLAAVARPRLLARRRAARPARPLRRRALLLTHPSPGRVPRGRRQPRRLPGGAPRRDGRPAARALLASPSRTARDRAAHLRRRLAAHPVQLGDGAERAGAKTRHRSRATLGDLQRRGPRALPSRTPRSRGRIAAQRARRRRRADLALRRIRLRAQGARHGACSPSRTHRARCGSSGATIRGRGARTPRAAAWPTACAGSARAATSSRCVPQPTRCCSRRAMTRSPTRASKRSRPAFRSSRALATAPPRSSLRPAPWCPTPRTRRASPPPCASSPTPRVRKQRGEAARAQAERFSWPAHAAALQALYARIRR